MSRIGDKIRSLFGSSEPKPVPRSEAEQVSRWVSEGGAYDPKGPPPVVDGDKEK
jgi:hypothetical protein